MKKRYLYVLIFAVPAFIAAGIISIALFGVLAGALWIFILGDDPWPEAAGTGLVSMLALVFFASWLGIMAIAYFSGKKQESRPALNRMHLALSAAATALLLLLVVMHQFGVGNLGPPIDSVLCSNACREEGFSSSGMPPKNSGQTICSCFDAKGNEKIKLDMEKLRLQSR